MDTAYQALRTVLSLPQSQALALRGSPRRAARDAHARQRSKRRFPRGPILRAFSARKDMAQHSVALANAEWKPSLALTGNLQYQDDGVDSLLRTDNQSYTMGLALRVPLFAAPGAAAKRVVANAQVRQSEHGLNAATDAARLEVESAWTAFEAADEVVTTQQKALELARESVDDRAGVVRERRHHVGRAQRRAGAAAADRVVSDAGEIQPDRRGREGATAAGAY